MRHARWIALVLLPWALGSCSSLRSPAWKRPAPPARDAPVVQPGALHRAELPNGLRIVVLEDRRLPRLALTLTLRRGEGALSPQRAGLASFSAEVMERGAGERGALALARAVDEIGASLSVGAGWDATAVHVQGLSRDLETLLEILADVALRPRFEAAEARKARSERLAALEAAKDDPATLGRWNMMRTLYPDHRYGQPVSGTPETVARLDAAAARAHHQRVFVPGNAVLSASGDIRFDDFVARARALFGAWKPGPVPPAGPASPETTPPERRIVVVDRPDLGQARILLAHEGIARTDPERIAAQLMNSVVGGSGFSSRLMKRVRADEGLTYGVGSGFSMRRQPGPYYVSTFTRVAEVRRVVDLLLAELERARVEPPDALELEGARTLAVGRFALGLETSDAVMGALVNLDVHGLPDDALDTYRGRVRAVDVDDTARLARERLHPDRAAIVLVGPADQLVPQLEDLGPVEVVRP